MRVKGFFHYKGFYFQAWAMGYYKLNKDLEPSKREGRKFWGVVTTFDNLNDDEKEKWRIK